jgi:putative oxidoreductase
MTTTSGGTNLFAQYDKAARTADKFQSLLLLLIRAYIGYQSVIAGIGHLENFNKTAAFFAELRIPTPKVSVAMSASTEVAGGALLLLGLASRVVALALAGNFLVAILTVELSNADFSMHGLLSKIWNDQSVIFSDTAFPFFATAVIVLIFGPGWYSIDGLIRYLRRKRAGARI